MSPCKTVLLQQIKRVNSICSIWNQANPIVFPPHNNGWVMEDGKYSVYWFEGNATPPTLDDMVVGENVENSDDEETVCESHSSDDSDTSEEDSFVLNVRFLTLFSLNSAFCCFHFTY
ncbi:hypothetical protein GHT06_022592 [Daphnia sinensis]|uniref:Uncharacterized protein n=1 Tax=Daphnia sinensis TaxID=1820382 RepID=A0AAD5KHT1_9CRUS|nr:hypothetical protein GHT06_022592 [Daphnia sinensis]